LVNSARWLMGFARANTLPSTSQRWGQCRYTQPNQVTHLIGWRVYLTHN
jgi:hypothetical protein